MDVKKRIAIILKIHDKPCINALMIEIFANLFPFIFLKKIF